MRKIIVALVELFNYSYTIPTNNEGLIMWAQGYNDGFAGIPAALPSDAAYMKGYEFGKKQAARAAEEREMRRGM